MLRTPIVLCDVMNTLVRDPFFTDVPPFFGMSLQELMTAKHPTSWFEFERGEIDEAAYFARFFRDGRPIDGDGLRATITAGYAWLEGMEALLGEVRGAGVEIHALSNYPVWHGLIEEKLSLSRYLEWSFVSCDTGVRKPDAEAYLGAARSLGVAPSDCLFIDDQPDIVAAAIDAGMPAIQRTSTGELRAALAEHGVLARDVNRR